MIISKTNIMANNSLSVTAGSITSGAITNIQDPDFSQNAVSTSSTFTFTVSGLGTCHYIALHGLSLPIGCVVSVSGTGFSDSHTVTRPVSNLVFFIEGAANLGTLTVSFAGSGTKVISYMQAGIAATVAWGTNAGQPLHYLASQRRSRVPTNQSGMPVRRVQEITIPRLRLAMRNVLKSWARDDLQAIRQMYDTTGILSQLDYEHAGRPDESCALFELSDFSVNTHSQTTSLVDVSLTFKALA